MRLTGINKEWNASEGIDLGDLLTIIYIQLLLKVEVCVCFCVLFQLKFLNTFIMLS